MENAISSWFIFLIIERCFKHEFSKIIYKSYRYSHFNFTSDLFVTIAAFPSVENQLGNHLLASISVSFDTNSVLKIYVKLLIVTLLSSMQI